MQTNEPFGPALLNSMTREKHNWELPTACQIWKGGVKDGNPVYYFNNKKLNVRRLVFRNIKKIDISPGQIITSKCLDSLCVAQDHLVAISRKDLLERNTPPPSESPVQKGNSTFFEKLL